MTEENDKKSAGRMPEPPDDENAFKLRFLDPAEVKFFRAGDALRVTIEGDRSCLRVVPMRSFPISLRDQYISIRDMEGNELGMVRDPSKLDKESRKLLEEEIRRRYFTPMIHRINSMRDRFGVFEWDVETDRGPRKFLTRSLHDGLKETDIGFIITDMENNRYELRRDSHLDPHSAAILARRL